MGAATAWRLAGRDREMALIERFRIGHHQGSSHGPTRVFRYSYADPLYVHMARRVLPMWRAAEDEAGQSLLDLHGGIDIGPREALEPLAPHSASAAHRSTGWTAWRTGFPACVPTVQRCSRRTPELSQPPRRCARCRSVSVPPVPWLARMGPDRTFLPDEPRRDDPVTVSRVINFIAESIPAAGTEPAALETCLYTNTPDNDFVLDRVGPLVVASPRSGHGFKFAPLVGEICARLALGEDPEMDLSRFSLTRFQPATMMPPHRRA